MTITRLIRPTKQIIQCTSRRFASTTSTSTPPAATPKPKYSPADFPVRTKPRWQNPPGTTDDVQLTPQFPLLAKLQKFAHYGVVGVLIGLFGYSSYCVGYNYYTIRSRRLQWEKENPEHHARLVAEAAQRKKDEAAKGAAKYGLSPKDEPTPPTVAAAPK